MQKSFSKSYNNYKKTMTRTLIRLAMSAVVLLALSQYLLVVVSQTLDGCPERCGDFAIPYPFGTKSGCFFQSHPDDTTFSIECRNSTTPYVMEVFDVANISLDRSELQISNYLAQDCYDRSGNTMVNFPTEVWIAPYTISNTRNMFMAVGCDTFAFLTGYRGNKNYTIGCMSSCQQGDNYGDASCAGVGCCQVAIPSGLVNMTIQVFSVYNHTNVWDFNPCGYAFLMEQGKFQMSNDSFRQLNQTGYYPPFVVNWSIGDVRCEEAKSSESFLCKAHTECLDSENGAGYLCRCLEGYQGNPYLPHGCQDIDECATLNPCVNATCTNTPGSFTCSCQTGYSLTNNGTSCINKGDGSNPLLLYIPLSASISLVALAVASFMLLWGLRKRKLIRLKEKFFEQNGGLMLKQQLSILGASTDTTMKIYTLEELNAATKNFHETRILGEGGYGTVYKGVLADNREVAIKRSKIGFQTQNEQFINEVIVLMQINHKNVVKLLGCCLETQVPIIVYEFIENRTLFDHIHNNRKLQLETLSWESRLKIAAETADALAYLTYQTSVPIFHRDVKTANILLDKNFTAKVSDFGTSRLIPQDEEYQVQTYVQGTFGYLDPEYMLTSQLTEKSDVYSFGVVLAELLTSRKVLTLGGEESERNLVNFFVCAMKENRLEEIVDKEIVDSGTGDIEEVAKLASRCLRMRGEERPSMKDVAAELADVMRARNHTWREVKLVVEETHPLLGSPINLNFTLDTIGADMSSSMSIQGQMIHGYGEGR